MVSVTDNGQVFHINTRGITPTKAPVSLPEESERRAQEIIKQYPQARSAIMPLLYITQEHFGLITQAGVDWVAAKLSMPPVQVWEVATFYTMYYKKPVGKYHIQVCRTLPCALRGARKISEFLHQRLGLALAGLLAQHFARFLARLGRKQQGHRRARESADDECHHQAS